MEMAARIDGHVRGGRRQALLSSLLSSIGWVALLSVATVACGAAGTGAPSSDSSPSVDSPTSPPGPTVAPTPTKTPFFWKLLLDGSETFVHVIGMPVGSVCTPKAFLRSGRDISGPGLTPKTVTNAGQGVSWTDDPHKRLLVVPSPAPTPGQDNAFWKITCSNGRFNPPSGTSTFSFTLS